MRASSPTHIYFPVMRCRQWDESIKKEVTRAWNEFTRNLCEVIDIR